MGGGRAGAETPTERQRRVWDEAAPGYDGKMALLERVWFVGGREWIGRRAAGHVLEVAIGTGSSLSWYPENSRLTGVDLSPRMLDHACRRAADLGRAVELVEADAEHLPFAEASFDTVVCVLALCSVPDPDRAVAEMARVLRPGGTLLLLDHVGSTWPPLWAAQWLLERMTIPVAGEHFTRHQLRRVEASGLQVVERERLKAGTIERIRAIKPSAEGTSTGADAQRDVEAMTVDDGRVRGRRGRSPSPGRIHQ